MFPGKPSAAATQKPLWQLFSAGTPSPASGATVGAADLREEGKNVFLRCKWEEQQEWRAGDASLLCFRLGNPSSGNSHLPLYGCRAYITYSVL